MDIQKDLVFEFFEEFSRFECALKRENFLKNTQKAEASWDGFAKKLSKIPNSYACEILKSGKYLALYPPQQQMRESGQIVWRHRTQNGSKIHALINNVTAVRNNLFHGGKYPDGPIKEPARNEKLVRCAWES